MSEWIKVLVDPVAAIRTHETKAANVNYPDANRLDLGVVVTPIKQFNAKMGRAWTPWWIAMVFCVSCTRVLRPGLNDRLVVTFSKNDLTNFFC